MNESFCAGSSTSSSALDGSPWNDVPSLSTSSSRKTGFLRAGLLHALNDATGHRADVRATVAADVGFVARAAERHAHVLAPERPRDRLGDRRLADARRSVEQQDRTARHRPRLGFLGVGDRASVAVAVSDDGSGVGRSSALSFAAGNSPVVATSSATCCARSWRTARNSSTRSFTSLRP